MVKKDADGTPEPKPVGARITPKELLEEQSDKRPRRTRKTAEPRVDRMMRSRDYQTK